MDKKKIIFTQDEIPTAKSPLEDEEGGSDTLSSGPLLNQTTQHQSNETGYLNEVSEIVVKQLFNTQEALRGTVEPNTYTIFDKLSGEKLFRVHETERACLQQVMGNCRPFKISIYDKFDRELILIEKTLVSCNSCCGIFDFYDRTNAYVRNFKSVQFEWRSVGSVRQYWCPLFPYFAICDNYGVPQFIVRGPLTTFGCFKPVNFPIKTSGGDVVGAITKEWTGICQETQSDIDVFQMKFPPGADEKMKVALMACLFTIDFKYYEGGCACCCCFCCCRKCTNL